METVTIAPEQIEYLANVIFMVGCGICFCLGMNAWESAAK